MEQPQEKAGSIQAGHELELLLVGDVHDAWDEVDARFVEAGGQAAVLFVGDLGDEDPEIVRQIASLACTKAVNLGNHDAWFASRSLRLERVHEIIDVLGEAFVGYRSLSLGAGRPLVVGGRPFSWGGQFARTAPFYRALFKMGTEPESVARILAAARAEPVAPIVLLGHNGPFGLGVERDAIFGRDFAAPALDFGDADLGAALATLQAQGRKVPLVAAGHMHHVLKGGGLRRRIAHVGPTLVVNAAVVPRHVETVSGRRRHFVRVALAADRVLAVEDLWVDDAARIALRESLYEGD